MALTPPQTPTTSLPEFESFTLKRGTCSYTFENDIFMKMSKKCQRLIADGITEETIQQQIRPDTFEAFYLACTLRPFKVTSQNAYELKKLSEDWEVNSLLKFVNEYIDKKGLQPPPEVDFLGILLDHLKNNVDDPKDVENVSVYINHALEDPRLAELPPEVIFRVVNQADPDQVCMDKLTTFTLHLFETKPTSAVPLVLLLDFDHMPKEQRDVIFQNKDVHELNIGYFLIQALSSARNKAEKDLNAAKTELENKLNDIRDNVKDDQDETFRRVKSKQEGELNKLQEQLDEMAKSLEELEENAKAQRTTVEAAGQQHEKTFGELTTKLTTIDELIEKRNAESKGASEQVAQEVAQQMDQLREEMDGTVQKSKQEDAARVRKLETDAKEVIDGEQKRLKELKKSADDLVNMLNGTNNNLYDLKAKLAAKIVRDRLRYDKFIRKTDNRFELFTQEPGLWGLKEDAVQGAEQFIQEIEDQVDKFCPIRGKATDQQKQNANQS